MKYISRLFLSIPIIFLVACSSKPPIVEASVSMIQTIKPSPSQHAVPKDLWESLSSRKTGETQNYKDIIILFGPSYTSALGSQCRKVTLQNNSSSYKTPQQRIVCLSEDSNSWFITPNVVDSKSEMISLSGI